jgi:hypothetical protein
MAVTYFRGALPEDLVIEVCTGFTANLRDELRVTSGF